MNLPSEVSVRESPSRFPLPEPEAQGRRRSAEAEEFRWTVTDIKDEPGKPGWSYTTGFFEHYQHPEVIIFGLKPESRHTLLNWIVESPMNGSACALFCKGRG